MGGRSLNRGPARFRIFESSARKPLHTPYLRTHTAFEYEQTGNCTNAIIDVKTSTNVFVASRVGPRSTLLCSTTEGGWSAGHGASHSLFANGAFFCSFPSILPFRENLPADNCLSLVLRAGKRLKTHIIPDDQSYNSTGEKQQQLFNAT